MRQLTASPAPNSAPSGGCPDGQHVGPDGICAACGEWLPVAWCRDKDCGWRLAAGEQTLDAAVEHHCTTGHSIRVLAG